MSGNEKKLKTLIISGRVTKEHDYSIMNQNIRKILESTGRFDVKITEEFTGASDETLASYDLVVLNYDGKDWINDPHQIYWGKQANEALYKFVREGKGIVFYHSSVAAENEDTDDEFKKIMGLYITLSGGSRRNPNGDFKVKLTNLEHPINKGLATKEWMTVGDDLLVSLQQHPKATQVEPIATVYDELENYKVPGFPPKHMKGIVIPDGDLSKMPGVNQDNVVAWTNRYGKGRAFGTTLGHDIDTMRRIGFLTLLVRGAEWAATGEVTLDPPDRSGENRLKPWPYY